MFDYETAINAIDEYVHLSVSIGMEFMKRFCVVMKVCF
jgi:hypothetical protein